MRFALSALAFGAAMAGGFASAQTAPQPAPPSPLGGTAAPIALLVKDNDRFRTVQIAYHDGLRYPHLEPAAGGKASLDDILRARP